MSYFIEHGLLKSQTQKVVFIPSPNYNERPNLDKDPIRAIVIHNISLPPKAFGKHDKDGKHFVSALFTNTLNPDDHPYFATICDLQVSAHLFIERNGNVIQYVNFDKRAWHAGASCYLGQNNCNDYSIGIELEGTDESAFEPIQYTILSQIIIAIYDTYPKTKYHLTGHSDIAPKRKTDPGACFDWQLLRKSVQDLLKQRQLKAILPELIK